MTFTTQPWRWIGLSLLTLVGALGCSTAYPASMHGEQNHSVGRSVSFEELPKPYQQLLMHASKAMATAYNPYSKFSVGAALLTHDNESIAASNVENAAYGSTICAERMALGKANSDGKRKFQAVAIIGRGIDFETKNVVAPCGSCRQMLYEVSQVGEIDMDVIMSNSKFDRIVIAKLSALLPMAFGPKDLGIDLAAYRKAR